MSVILPKILEAGNFGKNDVEISGKADRGDGIQSGGVRNTYARRSDDKLDRRRFRILKDPSRGEKGRENVQMFGITCSPKPFLTRTERAIAVD